MCSWMFLILRILVINLQIAHNPNSCAGKFSVFLTALCSFAHTLTCVVTLAGNVFLSRKSHWPDLGSAIPGLGLGCVGRKTFPVNGCAFECTCTLVPATVHRPFWCTWSLCCERPYSGFFFCIIDILLVKKEKKNNKNPSKNPNSIAYECFHCVSNFCILLAMF